MSAVDDAIERAERDYADDEATMWQDRRTLAAEVKQLREDIEFWQGQSDAFENASEEAERELTETRTRVERELEVSQAEIASLRSDLAQCRRGVTTWPTDRRGSTNA